MSSIRDLLARDQALAKQIAAHKTAAVAQVVAFMQELGVTPEDMGLQAIDPTPYRSRLPPKYRDANGNTWTGVGKRPTWLRVALQNGATLSQFRVKE